MHDQQLFLSLLSSLQKKLRARHFSETLAKALFFAAGSAAIWALAGRILIIPFLWEKMAVTAAILLAGGIVYAAISRPKQEEAARRFDDLTGEEAVSTALSCLNKEDAMYLLQRKDTVKKMKEARRQVDEMKAVQFPRKPLYASLLLIALVSLSTVFPNTIMEHAEQKETEKKILEETKKEAEKLAEEKKPASDKINKELAELQKELNESKTAEQSLQKILEKERKTAELKKEAEAAEKRLNSLADEAAGNNLNELSQALKEMDQEKASRSHGKA